MNLVFGLVLLGVCADLVWAGITDPEGGPLGGLTQVFQGQRPAKRVSSTAGAFVASVTGGQSTAGQVAGSVSQDAGGASVSGARAQVLAEAHSWLGVPYLWGGNTKAGVDCSGLTSAVYATVGVNLPRVSAAQALMGRSTRTPQAGDLVAFGVPVHHVGVYIGAGRMIHSPHPGRNVSNEAIWDFEPVFYRNVLDAAPKARKAKRRPKAKGVAT